MLPKPEFINPSFYQKVSLEKEEACFGLHKTGTFLYSDKTVREGTQSYYETIEEEVAEDKSRSRARYLLYRTRTEKNEKAENNSSSGLKNLTFGKNTLGRDLERENSSLHYPN